MELETVTIRQRKQPARGALAALALRSRAKYLVRASKESREAAKDILRTLPGVFSMTLTAGTHSIRLIKEADQFRIMKKSEKSDIILDIEFRDLCALLEAAAKQVTMQKLLAENRLTFRGRTQYFAALMRVYSDGDRVLCSESQYLELYGKENPHA